MHRAELVDDSEFETWKKERLEGLQDPRLCADRPATFPGFVSGLSALEQSLLVDIFYWLRGTITGCTVTYHDQ